MASSIAVQNLDIPDEHVCAGEESSSLKEGKGAHAIICLTVG
jgi:hypothetical protein